jgi:hypothetical protein
VGVAHGEVATFLVPRSILQEGIPTAKNTDDEVGIPGGFRPHWNTAAQTL